MALSFNPSRGPFGPSLPDRVRRLLRPLLTSASRSGRLTASSVPRGTRCGSPGVSPASFVARSPDLQRWPLMDMDFAISCPLVRPPLPRIRFLFVKPRLCSTLPSDGSSRFRPCASLVLHLHQVAQGTFTPKTPDMPGTQERSPPRRRAKGAPLTASAGWKLLPRVRRRGLSRPRRRAARRRRWPAAAGPDLHPRSPIPASALRAIRQATE